MATLVSPGVSVSIIDESFYDSSTTGSVPLIVIATASNKISPSGTGVAPSTTPSAANQLFIATSQRELIQSFGNPLFYSSGGSPVHGYELNEYGLHAAYQYLGLSNRAYILRADVDTSELLPSDQAPKGAPASGTFWFDVSNSRFGVFKSNGKPLAGEAWVSQNVTVFSSGETSVVGGISTPLSGLGSNGDFGIVIHTNDNYFFEKISGSWYRVGSSEWKAASPTVVNGTASHPSVTIGNSISINGTSVSFTGTTLVSVVTAINNANITNITAAVANNALRLVNSIGGDIIIANGTGSGLTALGLTAGSYDGNDLYYSNSISYPTGSNAGDVWIKGSPTNNGASWTVKVYNGLTDTWQLLVAPFYSFNSTLVDGNSAKDAEALSSLVNVSVGQVYIAFDQATGKTNIRRYSTAGYFENLSYQAGSSAPTSDASEGARWFSDNFKCDIMVSDGTKWIAYKNEYPDTNPTGVILSGSVPVSQSDGSALVGNDLWIDTSSDEYPLLYRFNATIQRWVAVDLTDQTSPFGVIFADARQDSGVAFEGQTVTGYSYESEDIEDMLVSDYVDPDAPDPRTTPAGMMLFNTRYSTNNVKEWKPDYFGYGGFDNNIDYSISEYTVGDTSIVFPPLSNKGRWVTISGNRADGSPLMGRRAQRSVIVKAMAAAILENEDIRSEIVAFNLIAAPGYPELIDEMTSLNDDMGNTAFVVGDTPIRLKPSSNAISEWATNAYGASSNGEDGLLTASEYVGIYYPWGLGNNIEGSEIVIPPSTMVLRTIAYNDQVAYPWFSPAGSRRGLISNAQNVGYLDAEGEFRPALLNSAQRDTLVLNGINAIGLIQNRGLVVHTQRTRAANATTLDRVNVARLVNYLRTGLTRITIPFLHEQHDAQTRDSARITVERFLAGIAGLRGIDDFAVLCSEDNNTEDRVARNELWIDVAIKPVKAVEFIYIPVRIVDRSIED